MNTLLSRFLDTVHRDAFSGFPLRALADGRIAGEYLKVRLESRFRPVIDADGAALGRAAELVATGPDRRPLGEAALARLTRVSESPVVLDRFIRCLHLLNHLNDAHAGLRLFLPVSAALIERVGEGHGRAFRRILGQLGPDTGEVAFLLPAAVTQPPQRLARLLHNYAAQRFDAYLPLGRRADGALRVRRLGAP